MNARATFSRMDQSTAQDWQLIAADFKSFSSACPTVCWRT